MTLALDTSIHAAHDSGPRDMGKVNLIVLHSTEGGPNAKPAALWFANKASGGSAHIVVGDDGAYRTLPDEREPWAAPGANSNGLHLEMAGYAKWSEAEWKAHPKTLQEAAEVVAMWCTTYGIPAVYLDALALHDETRSGVTTHNDVSKAFKHSDHTDPGQNFPLAELLVRVADILSPPEECPTTIPAPKEDEDGIDPKFE